MITSALPPSAHAALAGDDFRGLNITDDKSKAVLMSRVAALVSVLLDAGATDLEVHSILAAHPTSCGRLYYEDTGIAGIAALCDSCRQRPKGDPARVVAAKEQLDNRYWIDVTLDLLTGPHAGQRITHAMSFHPIVQMPGRPWWRTSGWWRAWEACGEPYDPYGPYRSVRRAHSNRAGKRGR